MRNAWDGSPAKKTSDTSPRSATEAAKGWTITARSSPRMVRASARAAGSSARKRPVFRLPAETTGFTTTSRRPCAASAPCTSSSSEAMRVGITATPRAARSAR